MFARAPFEAVHVSPYFHEHLSAPSSPLESYLRADIPMYEHFLQGSSSAVRLLPVFCSKKQQLWHGSLPNCCTWSHQGARINVGMLEKGGNVLLVGAQVVLRP